MAHRDLLIEMRKSFRKGLKINAAVSVTVAPLAMRPMLRP
jgi:hypothetical protein